MDDQVKQGGGVTRYSFLPFQVKSVKDDNPNVLTFRGTVEKPDRDGDVVRSQGVILDNYLKNPLFLYGHDWHGKLPIGKAVDIRVENKHIDFDIEFDAGDPFAMDVKRKYEGGYLNAVSVGFIPKDYEEIRDKETNKFTGLDIKEWELLELSAVPIPAHPDALRRAYEKALKEVEERVDDDHEEEHTEKQESSEETAEGDEFVTSTFFAEAMANVMGEIESLKQLIKGAPTETEGGEQNEENRLQKGLDELGMSAEEAVRLLSERAPETDQSVALAAKALLVRDIAKREAEYQVAYRTGKAYTLKSGEKVTNV